MSRAMPLTRVDVLMLSCVGPLSAKTWEMSPSGEKCEKGQKLKQGYDKL